MNQFSLHACFGGGTWTLHFPDCFSGMRSIGIRLKEKGLLLSSFVSGCPPLLLALGIRTTALQQPLWHRALKSCLPELMTTAEVAPLQSSNSHEDLETPEASHSVDLSWGALDSGRLIQRAPAAPEAQGFVNWVARLSLALTAGTRW